MTQNENPTIHGDTEVRDGQVTKKQYHSPQLLSYGDIAALTRNNTDTMANDNPVMMS